jgi:hypothetical protein
MRLAFPVPEDSIVTQTFAEHEAYREEYHLQFYNGGIDYGVVAGTPVHAAATGNVIRADGLDSSGYGNHVRIDHGGGYGTIYGHLSELKVKVNDMVNEGDLIGLSGYSGNCRPPGPAGSHLHFELRLNDIAIDPQPLLGDSSKVQYKGEIVADWGLAARTGPGKQYSKTGKAYPKGTILDIECIEGDFAKVFPFLNEWVCIREGTDEYLKLTPTQSVPVAPTSLTTKERLTLLEKQVKALLDTHPNVIVP